MTSAHFWDVTKRRLVVGDVAAQPVSPVFKGQCRENLGIPSRSPIKLRT